MSVESLNSAAKAAAASAVQNVPVTATGLVQYDSHGEVLLIGTDVAAELAPRLSEAGLKVQILLTEGEDQPGLPTVPQGGREVVLDGFLGNFEARLGEQGKPSFQSVKSDLVLDLGETPMMPAALKPPGYFSANLDDELSIAAAIDALSEMKGSFEKPRFFDYDADICAHSDSKIEACRNCLDACPAEAIISLGDRIEVNPNLCQGGGICATVCPTGAIRYTYPSREDSLQRVYAMLTEYKAKGGTDAVIAIVADEAVPMVEPLPDNVLPLVVEELASIGLEVWLSALAMGATQIQLHRPTALPGKVEEVLQQQLATAHVILQGLGYPQAAISIVGLAEASQQVSQVMPDIEPMPRSDLSGKRPHAFNAIDYLFRRADAPEKNIPLPATAPFGRLLIDKDACTLCMACTTVCPAQAVRAGKDAPRLVMHESECVQCGLCATACPEKAITLEARLITDPELRHKTEVLHEETPFCCISCGKPFASQSAIKTIMEKLSGHQMFQTERAKQRLKMCEDCRVVDIVQDDEMMGGQKIQS